MRLRSIDESVAYLLVSAAILAVLLLQVTMGVIALPLMKDYQTGTTPTPIRRFFSPPMFWPFVNYPMYAPPRFEGDTIRMYTVIATFSDGSEQRITAEDLGIGGWHFGRFIGLIRVGDKEKVKEFLESYRSGHGQSLDSLRLELLPLVLYEDGPKPARSRLINSMVIDARSTNSDSERSK